MSKRFVVVAHQVLTDAAAQGKKVQGGRHRTVYRVVDTKVDKVAHGTEGRDGKGGYATRAQAQRVADRRNRETSS